MCVRLRSLIVPTALIAMVCSLAGTAVADTIANIEAGVATGTAGTVIDGFDDLNQVPGPSLPIITNILSQPGTFNGKTYSSWAFLANDGTGSCDVFGKLPTGSTVTPAAGLAITATGTWSPYNQIPELETLTGISQVSTGNAVPGPVVTTIPHANQTTIPADLAGNYVEIPNVTVGGYTGDPAQGFGTSANLTLSITDSNSNSMVMYYWESSYSVANQNLANKQIPTTPVDVYGIVDCYNSTQPEFIPINITNPDGSSLPAAVPEPGTLALLGAGFAVAAAGFIRRRFGK